MKTRSRQQPAESSHDELQRTLASIVEFSDDAIISKTLDGIVTTWNKAAERMFGYTAEEMIGVPISILAPPDKVSEIPQILERIRKGERVEHYETVRLHKDGHPVAISLTVSPLRDQGGRIVGASKIAHDISKAHEESRFRRLLEAAPDAILEVDVQGQIVLINQVAETMFGYSREELLRMNVESLVPAAMRGKHHGHRAAYTAAPQTRPMGVGLELKAQRKDGSLFPIEIRLSPNWTGGVLHVIALVRDISERKESQDRIRAIQERYAAQLFAANQQLEARNEEVEKANRLKSEFLASMSH
ncbi:MAG TPA: PAS domain S-box protein, partial [Candidatus Angelobacter sp.]|nr:PAS domain S-box protein [Candidatus Angelobacter sp.]